MSCWVGSFVIALQVDLYPWTNLEHVKLFVFSPLVNLEYTQKQHQSIMKIDDIIKLIWWRRQYQVISTPPNYRDSEDSGSDKVLESKSLINAESLKLSSRWLLLTLANMVLLLASITVLVYLESANSDGSAVRRVSAWCKMDTTSCSFFKLTIKFVFFSSGLKSL